MSFAVALAMSNVACAADLWAKKSPATGGPELLSAEAAFQLASVRREGQDIKVDWVIAPGYYLYRKRLAFEIVAPKSAQLGAAALPHGATVHDEHFGDVEVYRETLQARLPVNGPAPTQLRIRYQGCADAGVCYPPVTRVIDIGTP